MDMGRVYYNVLRRALRSHAELSAQSIKRSLSMVEAILTLKDISKKYGGKNALLPLSLEIAGGDCLAVFGANGAGKSTLLKILSQQTKASGGEIHYKGTPISKMGLDYRGRLGVISHQPFLYEGLSALENLTYYARLYDIPSPASRAKELLTKVELGKRMHDPVRTYSRGMLQRASIARALLQDPEIIFLDEPYTGLDRHASYLLTAILQEQIAKKITLLLVTHDLSIGYDLATTILILSKGRCVYHGGKNTPADQFESFYLSLMEGRE